MGLISKSKLKTVQNCELQFWLELNKPELKKYNSQSLFSFGIGNDFEKKVKALFPSGIPITSKKNEKALTETQEQFKTGAILFEAAFTSNNVIVRTDISIIESGSVNIIEIKSGTKLKEDYLLDALIQYWTIVNSGKTISKFEIWNVNNKTKNKDNVKKNDVTSFCIENKKVFDDLIKKTTSLQKEKEVLPKYGKHCENCPFYNECFKDFKNDPKNVYNLPHFDKKWESLNKKIITLDNPDFKKEYSEYWNSFQFQISSIVNNKFLVKKDLLASQLSEIQSPLNFLDFEAVSYSEPLFKDVKPYQSSLIQINYCDLKNDEILLFDDIKKYSKTSIAQKLVNLLSNNNGSILVWDNSLENQILDDLIKACKNDEVLYLELIGIKERIVDLSKIFEKCVYKPEFLGKYSQKLMTKLILNSNIYANSSINDGFQVSSAYQKIIKKEDGFLEIKKDLIQYGRNDVLSLKNLTLWCFNAIKK